MKKFLTVAFGCCLLLIILGAKWAVFDRYGSAMPDWDQWDGEGMEVLVPWFEGDRFLEHLFAPHNEHRVVVTKLQTLALTLANGQWDSRLLAVVNAMLHSVIGAGLWLLMRRWVDGGARCGAATTEVLDPRCSAPLREGEGEISTTGFSAKECARRKTIFSGLGARETEDGARALNRAAVLEAALFLLTVALFALPFSWQNTLGGFHSQQYWLIGLSLSTIVAWPFVRPWSAGWWATALVAAIALLTMGSGLLAPAVVVVVVMFRALQHDTTWEKARPTLILASALVVAGLLIRVEVPGHTSLKAQTLYDFVFTILRSMEWPLRNHDWAGPVLWLPWTLVLWRVLTGARGADRRGPQMIAALGGWVMLQIVATAYARGVGADYPASRYMDTLAVGAMANGAALAWLANSPAVQRKWRIATAMLAAAWLVLMAAGLYRQTAEAFLEHLPGAKNYYVKAESYLRGYLATNDPVHLESPDIPYPSAEGLIERLANPHLPALMPVLVRAPLPMRNAADAARSAQVGGTLVGTAFSEHEEKSPRPEKNRGRGLSPATTPLEFARTWGSYGPAGTATIGEWRSAPIAATLNAWLKFETAGQVGEPGMTLELRDAATDRFIAAVKPTRTPGDSWRAAYVRAPRTTPFVVVARDSDPSRWMAFSGPVEMGALSYRAWRVSKHGLLILCVASGCALLLAALMMVRNRRQRSLEKAAWGATFQVHRSV